MQELIMFHPDVYLPKTDFEREQYRKGYAEGKAKGYAKSLLKILAHQQVELSDTERQRILAERDIATLRTWVNRALTARSLADVF